MQVFLLYSLAVSAFCLANITYNLQLDLEVVLLYIATQCSSCTLAEIAYFILTLSAGIFLFFYIFFTEYVKRFFRHT